MKIKRIINFFIVNHFLCCTRFFSIKRKLLNLAGIKVGKNTRIVGPLYIGSVATLNIGDNCWIGKDLNIEGNGSVIIESNCDFGPHITLLTGSHKIGTESEHRRAGVGLTGAIHVGFGTWIGSRSVVLPNVSIGDMCVVAAGAVVTKDVKDNTLVGGVPAKIIREL